MKQFETGKKYKIFDARLEPQQVGTIEIISRTPKFVTYCDDFFNRTKRVKVQLKNDVETIDGFYQGVFATDEE